MEKPKECKICKETEFKFHESTKIYNPENDEEEEIENVYECSSCGAYHFDLEEFTCVQIQKELNTENYTPKLGNHMNP